MSRTTTVGFGGRYFWCWDDAFGVWMAYLAEEIDRCEDAPPELQALAMELHVWSEAIDAGADFSSIVGQPLIILQEVAGRTRQRAVETGSLDVESVRNWMAVDDLPVAGAFPRSGTGQIEIERILEVADMTIALLDGSLQPDPPGGRWFVGHTGDNRVLLEPRPFDPPDPS